MQSLFLFAYQYIQPSQSLPKFVGFGILGVCNYFQTTFDFIHGSNHFYTHSKAAKPNPAFIIEMTDTCILGSGLTGLVEAWHAHKRGDQITLFEASPQTGGVLQSRRMDGYLLDYGANTLSLRSREVSNLLDELGVLELAIDANPEANLRFIVRGGKLISLPHGPASFLSSSFLSPMGKIRLLLEPLISKGKNRDETVAEFISRRLGQEALTYAGNPFLSGVYAARPESLSLQYAFPALLELEQTHGSLFRGMLKTKKNPNRLPKSRLLSFPNGMQDLTNLITQKLPQQSIFLNTRAVRVKRLEDHWEVMTRDQSGKEELNTFRQVVCTLPAHQLSEIEWIGLDRADAIDDLINSTHFPLALVFHGYEKQKIKHPLNGFGFLVPEVENRKILGTLFSSTLFPDRAPRNHALLTTFVGGERQPDLVHLADDDLHTLVQKEHYDLLGTTGEPSFQKIIRWSQAIPLPDHKMGKRKEAAKLLIDQNPGLKFSGSYLCGPPLPNCLQAAMA
jgi:oxygen-dependent protoporphyrinogen oxidase